MGRRSYGRYSRGYSDRYYGGYWQPYVPVAERRRRAMKKVAKYLVGRRDFKSFQASDKKKKSSTRTIARLDIIHKSPLIEVYIQADGFLYNMVRNIVGTLIDVGRGGIRPGSVKKILSKRHRPSAGQTAPAKGLCLLKVFY